MANRIWAGGAANDWSAANFGGSAPTNDDVCYFNSGTGVITTYTDSPAAVTGLDINVGPDFEGQGGSSGAPVDVGASATVDYNGAKCLGWYFDPAATCARINVHATRNSLANAFNLVGGTTTAVYVTSGWVVIGAAATVVTVYLLTSDAHLVAESGATITSIRVADGQAAVYSAASGGIYARGGTVQVLSNAKTIALMEASGSGVIHVNAPGSTVTLARAEKGGIIDASMNKDGLLTFTNAESLAGGEMNLDDGRAGIIASNNPKRIGGKLKVGRGITTESIVSNIGGPGGD